MEKRYELHEIEVTVKLKMKVVVSTPTIEKQLGKYPDAILQELKEELGYKRVELVSSRIEKLGEATDEAARVELFRKCKE